VPQLADGARNGLEALQRQSAMTHVRERAVEDRVARGLIHSGCEYCHEMQHAINLEYEHPGLDATTVSPRQLYDWYALGEAQDPTALPGFMTGAPQTGLDPRAVAGYPGVAAEVRAIERIRPILRQLGPDGFKVIDASMSLEGLSDAGLLAALDEAIEYRRADFSLLEQRIQEPGFDYLILRPVLRELLPLADPDVRALIEQSIARAQSDSEAMSFIVGVTTIAALLLTIFPPTAPSAWVSTSRSGRTGSSPGSSSSSRAGCYRSGSARTSSTPRSRRPRTR